MDYKYKDNYLYFDIPHKKCIFTLILQERAFQFIFDERVCG